MSKSRIGGFLIPSVAKTILILLRCVYISGNTISVSENYQCDRHKLILDLIFPEIKLFSKKP